MISMRWIVALIIADFIFLPMFHIYGVPFKIGYLILLGFFVAGPPRRGVGVQVFVTLGLLALITAGVWILDSISSDVVGFGPTFTMVATYLMGAAAFVFGSRFGKSPLRYVPQFMLIYFTVNIIVIMFWENLIGTAFGDFYGYVEDYLGTGSKLFRAGGLHQNPNVSARFMTVLLLGLFIGVRYGEIRFRSPLTILAIVVGLGLPVVVASRSEMLVSFMIVGAFVWVTWRSDVRNRQVIAALLITLVATTVLGRVVMPGISQTATTRIENSFSTLRNDPFNRINGLGRPIQAWSNDALWSKVSGSPLFGTADGVARYHNDWATILVRSGAIGMALFLLLIIIVARVHIIFLAPLFVSAMTNTFVFSPQHFTLYMLFVGIAWWLKPRTQAVPKKSPELTNAPHLAHNVDPNLVGDSD